MPLTLWDCGLTSTSGLCLQVEKKVVELVEETGMAKLDVDNYRIVFGMLDLDGGGNIEVDELQIGLKSIGRVYTDEQMQAMFDKVDEDKSGEIDFSEFLQFMLNLKDSADEASTDKPEANGEGNGNQDETSLEPDSSLSLLHCLEIQSRIKPCVCHVVSCFGRP